jgi:hypothetical protein
MKFPFREASPVGEELHNPWKLMFDIEIGEVYSVNQEMYIGGEAYEIKAVAFYFISKAEEGCEKERGIPEFPRQHAG